MLETLRRRRRLTLGLLWAFSLVLLVAMLASAQTRKALPLPLLEICTSTGDGMVTVLHDGRGAAQDVAPSHHTDPACVLCLAWSAPPADAPAHYRPPSPHASRLWWAAQAPRAQRSSSGPPPLRGPPGPTLV